MLLEGARSFIMRQLVAKLTHQNMNIIGSEMAFYLLTKIFHKGEIAADDALKIAQTYSIDLSKLEKNQCDNQRGERAQSVPSSTRQK